MNRRAHAARGRDTAQTAVVRSEFFQPNADGVAALSAEPLVAEWQALARRTQAAPFLCPEWTSAWWRAFAEPGARLALWGLRRHGRIAALLPMVETGSTLRAAVNHHTPQWGLLAEDPAAAEALVCGLLLSGRADQIVFPALDPLGGDPDACRRAARHAGHATLTLPHATARYVNTAGTWDAWEAQLGPATLRHLQSARSRLEQLGALAFDVCDGGTALTGLLESAYTLEACGEQRAEGAAPLRDAGVEAFYSEIAAWASAADMLRLACLRLDGKPLALLYALEHRGAWHLLQCRHDAQFRREAPAVLLHECFRHCFTSGIRRVELGGAMDADVLRWAPQCRTLQRLCLFPASMPGRIARLRTAARPWMKSWCMRLNLLPRTSQGASP